MKSKFRNIIFVMLILTLISVVAAEIKSHINNKKQDNDITTENQGKIDMSLYYTFADIKSDVSYLADSDEKTESLSRLVDALNQSKPVDAAYIKAVCQTLEIDSSVYIEVLGDFEDEDYITKEQFDNIYANIQGTGSINGLDRYEVYVFETYTETGEDGVSYNVVSDGYKQYIFDTDIDESFLDKIIDVYSKNGVVYKIIGYGTGSFMLENVWIEDIENGYCTFLYDNVKKTYNMPAVQEQSEACVADVTIDNTGIIEISASKNMINTRVTKVYGNYFFVDSENDNRVTVSDNFMIYNVAGEAFCEKDKMILLGYSNIGLIKKDNVAVAAIIRDELINDYIRVILSNDDYTSYDMENVIITSDGSYIVTYPDGTETTYEGGAEVSVTYADYEPGDTIYVSPLNEEGLKILSINREYGNPVYKGDIEIDIYDEDLNIINVVPMETYLYSVLSSEMPSGGNPEALKAMAVCYRAYAYVKLKDGSFAEYNANLDDSSLCQLYNSYELRDDCIQAVKDTYGIVASYKGEVITPFTYSTCYGVTSTNDEVWGGNQYKYFLSKVDNIDRTKIDLSNEDDFKQFMSDSMGYDTIDKDMPYYRWTIDFTFDEMTNAVDLMLAERISISADNIKIKTGDDTYVAGEIDDIGEVLDIRVEERTGSGVVSALLIEGEKATIMVTGSSNIRNLITPVNQQIVRQDGSIITGWTSLPSPYYYVEKTSSGYTIHGGGFGYGVGLSKNGASNLAIEGYNYKYIIHHYYAYVEFVSIYGNNADEGNEEEIIADDTDI